MRAPVFTGVCTALVTPFHESGSIDYDTFAKLIDYQISAKTAAISSFVAVTGTAVISILGVKISMAS